MPQLQGRKTFSHLTCCKTRASPKCFPRTHRFGKLFSIKKMRRQRRRANKANASGKTHRKVRSINNGIRKESFVSWIQILLPKSFHWSTNVLFAFFRLFFIAKIFLHLSRMPSGRDKEVSFLVSELKPSIEFTYMCTKRLQISWSSHSGTVSQRVIVQWMCGKVVSLWKQFLRLGVWI